MTAKAWLKNKRTFFSEANEERNIVYFSPIIYEGLIFTEKRNRISLRQVAIAMLHTKFDMKTVPQTPIYPIALADVQAAATRLNGVVNPTPTAENVYLSEEFGARIFLKREDLQVVRSYKIRGSYNKMSGLNTAEKQRGVVCASAGNHAQGVAYSCRLLGLQGIIFMPVTTPKQKLRQVELFGKDHISIQLTGDTFDDCYAQATAYAIAHGHVFVHPFDDPAVMAGQGTVALEILQSLPHIPIDYLFVPVGGGGLAAGISTVFAACSPHTRIVGVEPAGAPAMKTSIARGENTTLDYIDKFVDGAAVKRVGDQTFAICKQLLHEVIEVHEGKVCSVILRLYNEQAIVVEPAGALSIAALDAYKTAIVGKNVVCVVSGSNNDITRTEEIRERSLLYEGLKHYFMVQFPQRPGALREFVNDILGAEDDIAYFQYTKKNNRESGPAIIGIELKQRQDLEHIMQGMEAKNIRFRYLNEKDDLFAQLI